ncbi:ATP-binding protein [Brevundimonas sp.]|uniref:ATP-binding protein n=1 Tax=Brevundimonas sp. TaxID=1871086 RepID=UPI0025BF67A4|nr:ATP-binding protein [Brevundimonas sp.]
MAIDLSSLRKVRADQPPRLLIYGPEKMGKTTLASEFPAPVFLQTEMGQSGDLELDSFGHLTSYEAVDEALVALSTGDHSFQTVVLDSISALQSLIWKRVCADGSVSNIEQYDKGFGKGYVAADNYWHEVISALNYLRNERGMMIVLIGHAIIGKFDDPETETYSTYGVDLHKRAEAILKREVDGILLVKKEVTIKRDDPKKTDSRVRADGGDTRWIYTEGKPAFTAGNRYNMPPRIMYPKGQGYAALAPFFPAGTPAQQPTAAAA